METYVVFFAGDRRKTTDGFMGGQLQGGLRETPPGYHESKVGTEVLGFFRECLNGSRSLAAVMVLALDDPEHLSPAERAADDDIALAIIPQPVHDVFVVG